MCYKIKSIIAIETNEWVFHFFFRFFFCFPLYYYIRIKITRNGWNWNVSLFYSKILNYIY